jgi:O-antigen polysaccharide polymerase Wzy
MMTRIRSTTKYNYLLISILFALIGIFLFISAATSAAPYFLLILIIALILFIGIFLKRHIYLLSPYSIVIFAMFQSYVIRPLYLSGNDQVLSFAPDISKADLYKPLVLVILFTLSFISSYFCFKSAAKRLSDRLVFPFHSQWRNGRLISGLAILFFCAFISYVLMIRISGLSFWSGFSDPFAFRMATVSGGSFYVSAFALWTLWSIFYILAIPLILNHKKLSVASLLFRLLILVAVFFVVFLLSIPFGSRGYLLLPVLAVLWIIDSSRIVSRKPLNAFILLPILLAMILFSGFFGIYRQSGVGSAEVDPALISSLLGRLDLQDFIEQLVVRFDSFDFFASIVNSFDRSSHDYLYGRSILDFIVQPIPRSLLPDKVYKTSAFLTQTFFPSLPQTFTPEYGLITEAYINFGALGVFLGGALLGLIIRITEYIIYANISNASFILYYVSVIIVPLGWFLSGFNSDTTVMFLISSLLSAALLAFISRSSLRIGN